MPIGHQFYHILVSFLSLCHQQKGEQFNNTSVVKIQATFTLIYPINIASLHGNIQKFLTSKVINIKAITTTSKVINIKEIDSPPCHQDCMKKRKEG